MSEQHTQDLFVLTADADMKALVESLLGRHHSLRIREIAFDIESYHNHDGGCRTGAVEYLRPFMTEYRHAIVMFDWHGCGSESPREEIQKEIEKSLEANGWSEGRAKVIVIEPELEAWVWNGSLHVPKTLKWDRGDYDDLRSWLYCQELWPKSLSKPPEPKIAMERVLRESRTQKSSRIFAKIGQKVKFSGCTDPAFCEFQSTLRKWFG